MLYLLFIQHQKLLMDIPTQYLCVPFIFMYRIIHLETCYYQALMESQLSHALHMKSAIYLC